MFQNLFNNITPVVKNLLIINIIMFIATVILQNKGIYLNEILGVHNIQSGQFKPLQIVTYMFMHGSISHIFFNMFGLIMFGPILEKVWGHKRFLIYYFSVGIGAFFIYEIVDYISLSNLISEYGISNSLFDQIKELSNYNVRENEGYIVSQLNKLAYEYKISGNLLANVYKNLNTPMVGASGALFGILLAYGMYFPNTKLMLLFPPIPIKAKWFVIGYGAIELFSGISNRPGDNVAHFAHLGGMIIGFILIKVWQKDKQNFY
jgi:membrane associated rhomboid family serine protease